MRVQRSPKTRIPHSSQDRDTSVYTCACLMYVPWLTPARWYYHICHFPSHPTFSLRVRSHLTLYTIVYSCFQTAINLVYSSFKTVVSLLYNCSQTAVNLIYDYFGVAVNAVHSYFRTAVNCNYSCSEVAVK